MSDHNRIKHIVAGGIAGGVEISIHYPYEHLKTQMQIAPTKYTGVIDCGKQLVRNHGFLSLYRGVTPMILGSIPKAATRFFVFSFVQDSQGRKTAGFAKTLGAGIFAGAMEGCIAVAPMETLKTRMVEDKNRVVPRYRGVFHAGGQILKHEGVRGVWSGTLPTMARQMVTQACRFPSYFYVKEWITTSTGHETPNIGHSMFAGAVAGGISCFGSMPMDVVQTRMQSSRGKEYKNAWVCCKQIVREEGMKGLWKGTVPRLARVPLAASILFGTFEQIMKMLNRMD